MTTETKQKIQALLRQRAVANEAGVPLVRDPVSRCPASEGQRALWFAQTVARSPAYNIAAGFRIQGDFSLPAFRAALSLLTDRHEVLRTQLIHFDGELVQQILPAADLPLAIVDLTHAEDVERDLRHLVADECNRTFDLSVAPLARALLVKLGHDTYVALAIMHHAIGDAWSQNIVAAELGEAYGRAVRGDATSLPLLPVQYADFSRWQRALIQGAEGDRLKAAWRKTLIGIPALHGLPTDRPRQAGVAATGGRVTQRMDADMFLALQRLARTAAATPFHALLALYAMALSRFADTEEVIVGFASANRQRPELQGLIGYLVTALPARIAFSADASLRDVIAQVRAVVLAAMANQNLPLDVIVDHLGIARDPQVHPLFQLFFSYQEGGTRVLQLENTRLTPLPADLLPLRAPKFDISLVARRDEVGVELCWDFDARLFDAQTIQALADAFMVLAAAARDCPDHPAAAIAIPLQDSAASDAGSAESPALLPELFAAQLAANPERLAVVDSTTRWNYAELNTQAEALSQALAGLGVTAGCRVVVALPSTASLVAALLAVFRLGAAFVPVDPAIPASRLQQMIRGSGAHCLVTSGAHASVDAPAGCIVLDLETVVLAVASPAQALVAPARCSTAYIVHTSGSTGTPKGVMISHANLAHFVEAMTRRFTFVAGWTFGISTHPSTDIGLGNVFLALATGGTLHLIDSETSRDAAKYARYLQKNPIDVAKFTPSHYLSLYQRDTFGTPQPRQILILAGEPLVPSTISALADHLGKCRIVNSYGPSECSVSACVHELDAVPAGARVPIGRPLPGVALRVMGRGGAEQSTGAVGELVIRGPTVGQGYCGDVGDGGYVGGSERNYRTGDRVRRRADGAYEFLGRADDQVKIRGYRVELGEVEAALRCTPSVSHAAVRALSGEPGNTLLCAYVVMPAERFDEASILGALRQQLPEHMVPFRALRVDSIALKPNGKIDRDALPWPDSSAGLSYDPPRTATESALAAIWSSVLGVDPIGRDADFFSLGGNSLRTIFVATAAARQGVIVSPAQMLQTPRLADLAAIIDTGTQTHEESHANPAPFALATVAAPDGWPAGVEDVYPLTAMQEAMITSTLLDAAAPRYLIVRSRRIHGDFDEVRLREDVARVVAAHPVLRTSLHWDGHWAKHQLVHSQVDISIECLDLRASTPAERSRQRDALMSARRNVSLPLDRAPLFRIDVVRCEDALTEIIWTAHHAILDGWSVAALFAQAGPRAAAGSVAVPSAPTPNMAALVASERAALENVATRAYWSTFAADFVACQLPTLPGSGVRAGETTPQLPMMRVDLEADLVEALRAVASTRRVAVKAVMFAAYAVAVARLCGRSILYTGYCTHRRDMHAVSAQALGLYVTTLPVRIDTDAASWGGLIDAAHAVEVALWPHRHTPLIEVQRLVGGAALFEHYFNFNDFTDVVGVADDVMPSSESALYNLNEFALTVNVLMDRRGKGATLHLAFDPSRFEHEQAESFSELMQNALRGMLGVDAPIDLVRDALRTRIVDEWNATARSWDLDRCMHEMFLHQVKLSPAAPAVIDDAGMLTYGELLAQSCVLAHALVAAGVGPEVLVAVALPRGRGQVVATLGVLLAGGAYVPIEPSWPQARRDAVIAEAQIRYAIADRALMADVAHVFDGPPSAATSQIHVPPRRQQPDQLAYVIYTSGSTGRPKGVEMTHAAVVNTLMDINTRIGLSPRDRILSVSSLTFDLSVYDVFGALAAGACVVMLSDRQSNDPTHWLDCVRAHSVTVWNGVPMAAQILLDAAGSAVSEPSSLRHFLLSGDRIPPALPARLKAQFGAEVTSLGGATEAAIWSVIHPISVDTTGWRSVPYGRPMANQTMYVLDASDRLAAPGVTGQLHIGGIGLSRGYRGDPERTEKQFFLHALLNERLYRTGDAARFLPDGTIEILGRIDNQVKIRGYRVELGDIEAAIAAHGGISDVVVVLRATPGGAEPRLVAYFVNDAHAPHLSPAALRRHVSALVPGYMVPHAYVRLERMPTGSNSKLDRSRLPEPGDGDFARTSYVEPGSEAEHAIVRAWEVALRRSGIGVNDNFFELGGDSILALRVIALSAQAGYPISLRDFYRDPTIAAMAQHGGNAMVLQRAEGSQPWLPAQAWWFEQAVHNRDHFNQSLLLEVPAQFQGSTWQDAVVAVLSAHDVFRLRFDPRDATRTASYADSPVDAADRVLLARVSDESGRDEVLADLAESLQRSLDIRRGVTFRSAYLDCGAAPGRVLLVAHHLVIDAVSWDGLLRDLEAAYRAVQSGLGTQVGGSPGIVNARARQLQAAAEQGSYLPELGYWREQLSAVQPVADFQACPRRESKHHTATCARWSRVADAAFLVAGLSRHEILLAAVYIALRAQTGCSDVTIRMETHGRDDDTLDLASAPGWLTALFPLRLAAGGDNPIGVAESIAAQWRAVPNGGVGYGVLRYLAQCPELREFAEPRVGLNYFGEFGRQEAVPGLLRVCAGSSGVKVDPDSPRDCDLLISAAGGRDGLQLGLDYASTCMDQRAAAALLDAVTDALESLLASIEYRAGAGGVAQWPATPTQRGMVLHSQLESHRGVYINQLSVRLAGDIDLGALRTAWLQTLQRHDALRAAFSALDSGVPRCMAQNAVDLPWDCVDLRAHPPADLTQCLAALRTSQRSTGFDLTAPPLMRIVIAQLPAQAIELIWTYHHVLLDGWSLPIVLGDVLQCYAGSQLVAAPAPQFADYAHWLASREHELSHAYWRSLLQGLDEPTRLPLPAPVVPADAVSTATVVLDETMTAVLKAAASTSQTTVNAIVQAAWAYLLHRYTGNDEVVFGATHAGRPPELPGSDRMVGLFINTIPVRARVRHDAPVSQLVTDLFAQQARSVEHAYVPLAQIQAESPFGTGVPLFDSVVVFENYRVDGVSAPSDAGWTVEEVISDEGTHYPLTALAIPGPRLRLRVRGRDDRFLRSDVERIAAHWRQIVENIASSMQSRQSEIGLLTVEEQAVLQRRLAFSPVALDLSNLADAFAATVARHADRPAVRCADAVYSYAQIDARVDALARRLRALGVAGQPVGICLDRDVSLAVALLATLRAGATYVPLDPATPLERRRFIVADAACQCVITEAAYAQGLEEPCSLVLMDDSGPPVEASAPVPAADRAEAAYVIYTSGTTGIPKGVVVSHRSVLRLFAATRDAFGFDEKDVWPLFHSYAFDVSVWEMWGAWLHGGCLVMVPATMTRDPMACIDVLQSTGATVLNQTPTAFEALMRAEAQRGDVAKFALRHIIFAGEALDFAALSTWTGRHGLAAPQLWNLYGITETTVHTTFYRIVAEDIRPECRRVGRAIGDLQVRILDAQGRDVPVGVPGEIWVAGEGVAIGYHNRPELTAQRFVTRIWDDRSLRYYRSGDLGRYRDDGELECLGRNDRQVKLRGFRIELGEIEAQLGALDLIEKAVVLMLGTGEDRRIVAYAIAAPGNVAGQALAQEIRHRLAQRLPDHMVPSAIGFVADFPRNHNGKLDVAALPAIDSEPSSTPVRAADALERDILAIWSDVLGRDVADPDADFFALGGHSLKLGQVATRLRQTFGAELSFATLYKKCSAAGQAAAVRALSTVAAEGAIPALSEAQRRVGVVLTPNQLRLWYLCQDPEQNRAYGTHFSLLLRGPLVVDALLQALRATIDRHESLRSVFRLVDGQPRQVLVDRLDAQVVHRAAGDVACVKQAFDLHSEPPFRACLSTRDSETHELDVDIHHVASDAWSINLLIQEIAAHYRAQLRRDAARLPILPVQIADVAAWMDSPAQRAGRSRDLSYWREILHGHRGVLSLRTDGEPALPAANTAGVVAVHWPVELTAAIAQVCRARAITPFVVVLAAYALVLQRFSGDADVIIGSAVAQRPHPDIEPLIGFFAQTLPVRVCLDATEHSGALLERLRETMLAALDHSRTPLADIIESLDIERQPGRAPLFQTMLTLQNMSAQRIELPGIAVEKREGPRSAPKFDLTVSLRETDDGYRGEIEFDRRRLAVASVQHLADSLACVVGQLCDASDLCVGEIALAQIVPQPVASSNDLAADLDFLTLEELQKLLDGQEEASA
ncbi:non-ribosomal peptide synthetase [Tahibacter sp.]|uniref:non-ribosomal peptide synthetase n=1 Tax=Tahibacter sp. TaxID=2056211 RepID=UPI0028C4A1DF|nr:non-ribosomal peptide synthetase [Tahibacter sp.]